jgi:hypothetical protein
MRVPCAVVIIALGLFAGAGTARAETEIYGMKVGEKTTIKGAGEGIEDLPKSGIVAVRVSGKDVVLEALEPGRTTIGLGYKDHRRTITVEVADKGGKAPPKKGKRGKR